MKSKNAFETSGNSPTKVSENGAPVLTGRGLEDAKRRIMEAFQKIRQDLPAPPQTPQLPPPAAVVAVYTEQHATHFQERAHRLSLAALSSSHIFKATRSHVFEIMVPSESAEELIREALGE